MINIDYNRLYDLAREKFYDKLQTEDTFEEWAQKHTVMDHFEGALLIRHPTEEIYDGTVEFHDWISFILIEPYQDGKIIGTGQTLVSHFEELLQRTLSEREGHAETV